jgi:hypothetical protein
MAKLIPARSKIPLQIHSHRTSGPKASRPTARASRLRFAKEPPDKEVTTKPVVNYHFKIPARDDNHEVTSCYTVKEDSHIISLTPHMHLRGKDMTIIAYYHDSWKETQEQVQPDLTKSVRFGDPTYCEMMIGFVEYTLDSQHLNQDTARAAVAGK